ncbi:MAG: hypothetical protein CBC73_02005, partial [Flavobacteriales bacterium TMED113]
MIQKTPFYSHHINLSAKMVNYAGFLMPIYYKSINEEHNQVREKAGLFDVSHMGQLIIEGDQVVEYLQKLTTNNISKLSIGKVQYSCIVNHHGFVLDVETANKLLDHFNSELKETEKIVHKTFKPRESKRIVYSQHTKDGVLRKM